MARIFDIIPIGATSIKIQRDGGSVQRDLGMTYDIGEDAEQALDLILEPYGKIGGFYLDSIPQAGRLPTWAFVALSREYDIATYIRAQRNKIDAGNSFYFTIYDHRSMETSTSPPKVACFVFPSKNSVEAAAEKIRFLRPAWTLLQDKAAHQKWLVLLDEEPMDVMSEASSNDELPGSNMQASIEATYGHLEKLLQGPNSASTDDEIEASIEARLRHLEMLAQPSTILPDRRDEKQAELDGIYAEMMKAKERFEHLTVPDLVAEWHNLPLFGDDLVEDACLTRIRKIDPELALRLSLRRHAERQEAANDPGG
jgi:hypothetical protein